MTVEDETRYAAAAHGMQTGVMYELEHDPSQGTPKHLRTGVNSAMVEFGALVELLEKKGLFTADELMKHLADAMERERDAYATRLSQRFGTKVTLG